MNAGQDLILFCHKCARYTTKPNPFHHQWIESWTSDKIHNISVDNLCTVFESIKLIESEKLIIFIINRQQTSEERY